MSRITRAIFQKCKNTRFIGNAMRWALARKKRLMKERTGHLEPKVDFLVSAMRGMKDVQDATCQKIEGLERQVAFLQHALAAAVEGLDERPQAGSHQIHSVSSAAEIGSGNVHVDIAMASATRKASLRSAK